MKTVSIVLAWCLLLGLSSCKVEDEDAAENPFAQEQQGGGEPAEKIDSASIEGLHQTLFRVKCANPACHDGTFEPDFRTVESTYATMLWHGTVKPDPDTVRNLRYRVVPFEPDSSWLWERLTTNDTVNLGRMPSNGLRLPAADLANVRKWIENGARDRFGKVMQRPNFPPHVPWHLIFDNDSTRLWEQRSNGWASPFLVRQGQTMRFWMYVEDDSTAIRDLRDNVIKVSADRKEFTSAQSHNGAVAQMWGRDWWYFQIPTAGLEKGKVYYYRYFTRDPKQTRVTEIPTRQDPFWLQDNYSFVVY